MASSPSTGTREDVATGTGGFIGEDVGRLGAEPSGEGRGFDAANSAPGALRVWLVPRVDHPVARHVLGSGLRKTRQVEPVQPGVSGCKTQ